MTRTLKTLVVVKSVCASFLLAQSAISQEVKMTWLAGSEIEMSRAHLYADEISRETGVRVQVEFVDARSFQFDEFVDQFLSASEAGTDLLVGLSREQVQFMDGYYSAIQAVDPRVLENPYLPIYSDNGWGERDIVGVPFAVSVPVVCTNSGNDFGWSDESISLADVAYGGIGNEVTVAMPNPSTDSVGASVLVSTILAEGGVRDGWDVVGALDRQVNGYSGDHVSSCRQVAEGMADVGFTTAATGSNLAMLYPGLTISTFEEAAATPILYASWMDSGNMVPDFEREKILNWVSSEGVALNSYILNLDSDQTDAAVAATEKRLKYFPVQDIIDDWTLRYGLEGE